MKLTTTTALALVAVLSGAPAFAQYGSVQQQPAAPAAPGAAAAAAAQPKIAPSKGALKAIVDLQDTVNKNDFANVPAKVAAANAVATTKEDKYLVGELELKAAVGAKDTAGETAAIDEIAGSGYVDSTKSTQLYLSLGSSLYNGKQYPQAQAAFQKAAALDPRNAEATSLLGEALLAQGQKAEAAAAFQRAVQASRASGQKPDEKLLKRAVGVAYDANAPTAVEMARQWVSDYPSPESWRNSIAIYRNLNHPDVEGTLDLLRLMQAAGAMSEGDDYTLFARAAAEQNNYNEAQSVLDAGIAAKLVKVTDPNVRDLVNGLRAKPKATVADLATATKTAANGMALLRIGDRYYAMGNYAKAVELYRMAMGKPGVDPAVANLHVGMALARQGDKAGAVAALNTVAGPRADIARYWLAYVNQRA